MTDRLGALVQLRDREVDRSARQAAAAAAAQAAAAAARDGARAALETAREAHDGAVARRARAPADPRLQDYLAACQARVADAERALAAADRDLEAAAEAEVEARRGWRRASVRRDAIGGLVTEIRRDERRGRERRAADEAQDQYRSVSA
jgi:hypothetical protein